MKKLLYFILATFCLCIPAFAQVTVSVAPDAASREDILKLFDVMQMSQQMNQIMRQITVQMRSMSHDQMKRMNPNITADELAKIDANAEKLIEAVPVNDMLNDMVPVYQRHLTKSDVDAMIGFYSTPTGQKILREMPAMAAEGMQALQPRMRQIMDDTMRKIQANKPPGSK